jgi:hypothetical protein
MKTEQQQAKDAAQATLTAAEATYRRAVAVHGDDHNVEPVALAWQHEIQARDALLDVLCGGKVLRVRR